MADFKPHILSNVIECVYTSFFHSNSAQQLQNLPEEILFSCIVTTLNDTFEIELAQEDEEYESGSESINIPTPLRRASWIYYVSMSENLSFNPTIPVTTAEQHLVHTPQRFRCYSPVCCYLVFSSSDEEGPVRPSGHHLWHSSTPDTSPVCRRTEPPSPVQHHVNHHTSPPSTDQFFQDDTIKENFPTAPLDDDVLLEDQNPDRQWCIHDASQPNSPCHYPGPYVNLDFAQNLPSSLTPAAADLEYDIMDLMDTDPEDIMSTTSEEDILDLEDVSDYPDHSQLKAWFA